MMYDDSQTPPGVQYDPRLGRLVAIGSGTSTPAAPAAPLPPLAEFTAWAKRHDYSDAEIQQYVAAHPEKFTQPAAPSAPSDDQPATDWKSILRQGAQGALTQMGPLGALIPAVSASKVSDLPPADVPGVGASAAQGASWNLAGLAIPALRQTARAFEQTHPRQAVEARMAGGLAVPGLGLAKLLGKVPTWLLPLVTGTEGAVAGAAGADPGERLQGAVKTGLMSAALGAVPAVADAAGAVASGVAARANPVPFMARQFARNLSEDIPVTTGKNAPTISPQDALARSEALAPGSGIPAALTPNTVKAVRGVSADPVASEQALQQATAAQQALAAKTAQLKTEYAATGAHPAFQTTTVTYPLRKILSQGGETPTNDTMTFEEMQSARRDIAANLKAAAKSGKPSEVQRYSQAYNDLQDFMQERFFGDPSQNLRPLKEIDSDYGFTTALGKRTDAYVKMLRNTTGSQSGQKIAGTDAVSPGGTLTGRPSWLSMIKSVLAPAAPARARAIGQLTGQPTATMPAPIQSARQLLQVQGAPGYQPPVLPVAGATAGVAPAAPSLIEMLKHHALFGQ